jgi:hypothetical protein
MATLNSQTEVLSLLYQQLCTQMIKYKDCFNFWDPRRWCILNWKVFSSIWMWHFFFAPPELFLNEIITDSVIVNSNWKTLSARHLVDYRHYPHDVKRKNDYKTRRFCQKSFHNKLFVYVFVFDLLSFEKILEIIMLTSFQTIPRYFRLFRQWSYSITWLTHVVDGNDLSCTLALIGYLLQNYPKPCGYRVRFYNLRQKHIFVLWFTLIS